MVKLEQSAGSTTQRLRGTSGDLRSALDAVEKLVKDEPGPIIIAGDLHAKQEALGGEATDESGQTMMDLVGTFNLKVANDRHAKPTFQTGNGASWIDLILLRGVDLAN